MAEYAVYEPRYTADDPIERAEHLVFVKDGFHWWAAIVPAVWLMIKGLWLELAVCLLAIAALTWGLESLGVDGSLGGSLLLIAQLIFGFEAGMVESAALERRGWRRVGYVEGRNRSDCERRFIADWLTAQRDAPSPAYTGPMPKGPIASLAEMAMQRTREAASRWHLGSKT